MADVKAGGNVLWTWSEEAKAAFTRATGLLRVPNLNRGLTAALTEDAAAIFQQQVEGMIAVLTNHPLLGQRVLVVHADPDGKARLKIDADLIRFILFDELPGEDPPPAPAPPQGGEG